MPIYNRMIFVKGGKGQIGEEGGDDNPLTEIEVSDFYMSEYLVTQELYKAVMGVNPSYFRGARHPVEQVSWMEAVVFCNALSQKMGLNPVYKIEDADQGWAFPNYEASGFRLPTEAEWEYAAKGGSHQEQYKYASSDYLQEVAWYDNNSHQQSKPVGQKLPNILGLYDLNGNVYEWCEDDWENAYESLKGKKLPLPIDPKKRKDNGRHPVRGGSWFDFGYLAAQAFRIRYLFSDRNFRVGFRLSCKAS